MHMNMKQNKQQVADLVPFVLLCTLLKQLCNLNLVMAVHYVLLVFFEEEELGLGRTD